MTLLNLADRVEASGVADRELDAAIWCALNGHRFVRFIRYGERVTWGEIDGSHSRAIMSVGMVFEHSSGGDQRSARFQQYTSPPAYTSSLDVGVKLVPIGYDYDVHRRDGASGVAYCFKPDGDYKPVTHAATPALALTAACLRAIAHAGEAIGDGSSEIAGQPRRGGGA